jgi:phospholipid/cholesterol/gamma-HCH transport system permease protein
VAAAYEIDETGARRVLKVRGDWTVWTIGEVAQSLRGGAPGGALAIDVAELGKLDVAGAFLLDRAAGEAAEILGEHPSAKRLLAVARGAQQPREPQAPQLHGIHLLLDRIGRAAAVFWDETIQTLGFLGLTSRKLSRVLARPHRIRWISVVNVMERAGFDALPIIATLSFFIGLVVAFLGSRVLEDFGASVFTVELVAFSVLREFGAVITAILLAGRTNSAFTAELGAMKMRQEIDAMRVLGLDPVEALVVPRMIAMLVMTPLLTFAADMAGLLGGLLATWAELGISPVQFFQRIRDGVPQQHFWVGMLKSPFFGLVLALIDCRHGLETGSDVTSLGRRTTASVVQAIFLLIFMDALFAIWFLEMDW